MDGRRGVAGLIDVVARLRGPDGCPWDRSQTLHSLREDLVEEAGEVLEAIEQGSPEAVRDELGDALFLVLLLAQVASDDGWFDLDDVAQAAIDKMVRRHPHVFGDATEAPDWHALKAAERPGPPSLLDGVSDGLPPLRRADKQGRRVARAGFDWPDTASVRMKVGEELDELDEAIASGEAGAIEEELGDVLFSLAQLGRHLDTPADGALRSACRKFERRFRGVESHVAAAGHTVEDVDPATLEAAWAAVKETEA